MVATKHPQHPPPHLDLKKRYAALYKPSSKTPGIIDVPPLRFLMIDGTQPFDPAGEEFRASIQALYTLAYQVKFAAKKQLGMACPVMPLEALFWNAAVGQGSAPTSPEEAAWRLMIMLPDEVESDLVDITCEKALAKKKLPRLADIRVQTFSEGASVQILHVGPYADETATVDRLLAFAAESGLAVTGAHHEIYLNDPTRTAPEKLKTILRYGVRRLR